jgi:hypothetical protein
MTDHQRLCHEVRNHVGVSRGVADILLVVAPA